VSKAGAAITAGRSSAPHGRRRCAHSERCAARRLRSAAGRRNEDTQNPRRCCRRHRARIHDFVRHNTRCHTPAARGSAAGGRCGCPSAAARCVCRLLVRLDGLQQFVYLLVRQELEACMCRNVYICNLLRVSDRRLDFNGEFGRMPGCLELLLCNMRARGSHCSAMGDTECAFRAPRC